ncbi:DUF4268 domain-containing protein [Pedobacter sp. CAN_A7]|uniref:DUF4268 domain-containing protein n=1 Tax=Pedobacter sp. CAN_A7 TaxID=2787722 RepID=UPI0018CAEE00
MYSKEQTSALKQAFWTAFGQYMSLSLSADGQKINWINYKTGLKHLNFKMQAEQRSAYMAIEMTHPDPGIQMLMFEQFKEFKVMLEGALGEEWDWQMQVQNEHYKTVSRIYKEIPQVSVFKQEDWPTLISFFKPRIIALDEFWNDAQYSFDLFK